MSSRRRDEQVTALVEAMRAWSGNAARLNLLAAGDDKDDELSAPEWWMVAERGHGGAGLHPARPAGAVRPAGQDDQPVRYRTLSDFGQ